MQTNTIFNYITVINSYFSLHCLNVVFILSLLFSLTLLCNEILLFCQQ